MAIDRANNGVDSIQSVELAALLGDWTGRSGPLYARLSSAIADGLAYATLGGRRLPAERELAAHLGVSRGTVVAAYDVLRARGLAHSRRGSGTFVRAPHAAGSGYEAPIFAKLMSAEQAPIDLSMAALGTPELLPDLGVTVSESLRLLPGHGYAPLGAPALRAAIAAHLSGRRAGPTEAAQILVTTGGQGAISLLASGLIRPGDRVLVEAPTYPGANEVFSRAGARVEAVERDHAGIGRDALARALDGGPVRFLYLVPNCHNPTGTVMSEQRRREVRRLCAERGVVIVEDTAMAELTDDPLPPDLCAGGADGVVSVGSLSKSFWAGLRIGWIRASPELVQRLGRLRAAVDLGGPLLEQAVALRIFADFDHYTGPSRAAARERLALLVEQVRARLPDWRFEEPRGGWSVWLALPSGSADRFAQLALRYGVAVSAGRAMAPDDRFSGYLRLSAGCAPAQIIRGVDLLAQAWAQTVAEGDRLGEAIELPV